VTYTLIYKHKKLTSRLFGDQLFASMAACDEFLAKKWADLKKRGMDNLKEGDMIILKRVGLLFIVLKRVTGGYEIRNTYTGKKIKVTVKKLTDFFTLDERYLKDHIVFAEL
jgi:hypothetical protein